MPATKINVAEKFSALDGLTILYLPMVAATNGIPTRLEINGGTDLTTEIDSWEGFEVEAGEFELGGLSRFTGTIPGRITVTPGQFVMYQDRGEEDIAEILDNGSTGAIVFMPIGDVPTKRMTIWRIRVNRLSEAPSMEGASMFRVRFSHDRLPVERVPIPAAA